MRHSCFSVYLSFSYPVHSFHTLHLHLLQSNKSPMSCSVSLFRPRSPVVHLNIWIQGVSTGDLSHDNWWPKVLPSSLREELEICENKSCEIKESHSTLENDLCVLFVWFYNVIFKKWKLFIVQWRRLLLQTTWDRGLTIRAKDQSLKLKNPA